MSEDRDDCTAPEESADKTEFRSLAPFGFSRYAISNKGELWDLELGQRKRQRISDTGYPNVSIAQDSGGYRTAGVHRLVAKAFVDNPNPEEFNVVDHMDCDPGNPYADNLRWTNTRGNLDYQVQVGSLPPRIPDEVVHQICQDLAAGVGSTEISRKYGVSHDAVFQIKRGDNWRHISSQYEIIPPKPHNPRLKESQVIEICKLLSNTEFTCEQIAGMYGTSADAIKKIRAGVNWRHITQEHLHLPE